MGQGENNTSPKTQGQSYQPQPYQPMVYQQNQPIQQQQYQQQPQYDPNQQYMYQQQQQVYPQQPVYQQQDNMKQPLLSQPIQPQQVIYVQPYENTEKFPETPTYRDLLFHILFYVNLVCVVALYILSLAKDRIIVYQVVNSNDSSEYYTYSESTDSTGTGVDTTTDYSITILVLCGISVVFSLIFIVSWLKLASKYPRQLITYTFIANLVLCGLVLLLYIIFFNILMVIVMAFCFIINLIFFIMWRKRIEFTSTLLTNTTHLLDSFPGTYKVAYGSLIVSLAWFTLWGLALQRATLVYEGYTLYGVGIYLVFSLYWVGNVIKNVVHTTISGLFASWYFMAGGMGMPQNPTLGAFKRATTISMGSICLGSLLLAIISTLRYISQLLQNSKNGILVLIGCFFNCILAMMQSILAFFNTYNFTMIAIYGKSYCDSGKDTVALFTQRLGSLLVNDDFISVCLSISGFLGAIICGGLGALVSKAIYDTFLGGIFVFVISFVVIMISLEIVYSGVVSLFVCFMMDPQILAQTKPEIYKLYVSTYKIK